MTTTPKPSLLRLQFSLRWLLLLTTAVGVGLMVYRWPWEVVRVKSGAPYERQAVIITTLRRNWDGSLQKHGSERALELELHRGSDSVYIDGELQRRRFYVDGRMTKELIYHAGFAYRPRTEERASDEIKGVWQSVQKFDSETVTQRCEWRNAERHGLSTWTSSTGQVLQTAQFERGRVVRWNGELVAEALPRWVEENVSDPQVQRGLLRPVKSEESYNLVALDRNGFLWLDEDAVLHHFGFQNTIFAGPINREPQYAGRTPVEVLLDVALNESGMLVYRFGTPCIVPICTSELNWTDPTGIPSIKFAADSPQSIDWSSPIGTDWELDHRPAALLNYMCRESSLLVDTRAVDHLDPPPRSGFGANRLPPYPRPRRHLFAHVLYDAGYCCKLRDGTIVVVPGNK